MKKRNKNKKNKKTAVTDKKRLIRMVCLINEDEQKIIDRHLAKYKITNKSRWCRETILSTIYRKMEDDYPTLFAEEEMRY